MCAACVTHPPNVALYGVTPTSTPPTVLSQEIVCLGRWHRCPYNGILEQMSPSKCCKTQLLLEAFGFLFVHWLDWTNVLCQRLRKPSSPSFVQSSTKHGPSSPSGPSGPSGPGGPSGFDQVIGWKWHDLGGDRVQVFRSLNPHLP